MSDIFYEWLDEVIFIVSKGIEILQHTIEIIQTIYAEVVTRKARSGYMRPETAQPA